MTLWRYTAIPRTSAASPSAAAIQRGELAGESAADVRAALRRIGLQVIEIKPRHKRRDLSPDSGRLLTATLAQFRGQWELHLRHRRRGRRAEMYDSLATMLDSGLALTDALDTLVESDGMAHSMLIDVRERLRAGASLGEAMAEHGCWFDGSEVAMVNAAQHSGTLPGVLRSLAERNERADELGHKLTGVLAYPAIVAIVGLGVVIFLSRTTLPNLLRVLEQSKIEAPRLTRVVMVIGQVLADHWLSAAVLLLIAIGAALVVIRWMGSMSPVVSERLRRCMPGSSIRGQLAVARFAKQLVDLLRSGVPMVESLRVLAPTTASGLTGLSLRRCLTDAADRLERGDDLSTAMERQEHGPLDAEFRRLLQVGQSTGELDSILDRLAKRYERRATRLIDRLASLLEPVVILVLAAIVGTVIMAALLPLLKLQEIVR